MKYLNRALRVTAFIFIFTIFLDSCAAPLIIRRVSCSGKGDEAAIASLKKGQTQDEVIAIMGRPQSRETYRLSSGEEVEFLFYPQTDENGKKDMDTLFPLGFRDDKLVSMDCSYYDRVVESSEKL